ncbi:hypothetical protein BDV93DRAFT_527247 [Ceratobasidium sp. AG-I]|nr:hypothetical protein BDV93DRAFT_527247 [Ceratobasidium sp. AG-I]
MPQPSFVDRLLKRKSHWAPKVKAGYDFVVENYRAGDHVVMLDTVYDSAVTNVMVGRKNRRAAVRELTTALDTGSLDKSRSDLAGERIPIKCVFLRFSNEDPLGWPGVDQLLSKLPSTVESFLCLDQQRDSGDTAYVIQRGSYGQIRRKELWHSLESSLSAYRWVLFQTSHIIRYNPYDFSYGWFGPVKLLSTATYYNCTKRRGRLASDGAIPTGGQLARITKVEDKYLVWSSYNYVEGEYSDVCSTPLCGPESL